MSQDDRDQARGWQDIAAEASREKNPQKLLRLTQDLRRVFDERFQASASGPSASTTPANPRLPRHS